MLRVLIAAADDQGRAVPHLRATSEPRDDEPEDNQPAAAESSTTSAPPAPDTARGLRMVVRPGTKPAPPPGSPGQAAKVPAVEPSAEASAVVAASPNRGVVAARPGVPDEAEKAYQLTARANRLIAGGLHNCPDWEEVRELYFAAAAHFQAADLHLEAGEAFSNAAAISRVYGQDLEVATAAGYAVDSFRLADPQKAIALLDETMRIHRDGGRPKLEAKAAKDIAELYEGLGEHTLALEHYQRAVELYRRHEITRNFFLKCLERVARLSATLKHYRLAIERFEELAEAATRGTRVTERYLSAMLCQLADAQGERQAGTLARAKVVFDRYQDYDEHLQKGVEHRLVRGIIAAFDKGSLVAFDEAHKAFVEYRGKDAWYEDLIARIRNNLFEALLPYM